MGRIIGIDFGTKKVGLAATDPLQIIVTGLETVERNKVIDFLTGYCNKERVDQFIVGDPFTDGVFSTQLKKELDIFLSELQKQFPEIPIDRQDEAFTSERSKQIIFQSGAKKKKRRDKTLIDKVSAILILQEYLGHLSSIPEN